jgi:hypothetical protein
MIPDRGRRESVRHGVLADAEGVPRSVCASGLYPCWGPRQIVQGPYNRPRCKPLRQDCIRRLTTPNARDGARPRCMSFEPLHGPSERRRPFACPESRAEPSSQPTHLLGPISDPSDPSDPSDLSRPTARAHATGSRAMQPNSDDLAIVGDRSAIARRFGRCTGPDNCAIVGDRSARRDGHALQALARWAPESAQVSAFAPRKHENRILPRSERRPCPPSIALAPTGRGSGEGDGNHRRRTPLEENRTTKIVRNEESNLSSCLRAIDGLFDEIIIVDTGSTDRTVEIARSFGARISDFPWVDDFAAARNAAVARATCDYAFWLDADDVIDPSEREKLEALLRSLCSRPMLGAGLMTPPLELTAGLPPPGKLPTWGRPSVPPVPRSGDLATTQKLLRLSDRLFRWWHRLEARGESVRRADAHGGGHLPPAGAERPGLPEIQFRGGSEWPSDPSLLPETQPQVRVA